MPVIALQSHDLHRETPSRHAMSYTTAATVPPEDVDFRQTFVSPGPPAAAPKSPIAAASTLLEPAPVSPKAPRTVPLPTQPLPPPVESPALPAEQDVETEAGPSSHQRQSSIPPPANARRHRSGVLMSQARSRASSGGLRSGTVLGSKSFGDLTLGLQMSTTADEEGEVGREFRRITSEGNRRPSGDDDNLWDNSARFYHHLHSTSRPVSRQTSPERTHTPKQEVSPSRTSSSASPIHIRRSQILPQNGPGPPMSMPLPAPHAHQHAALSPAHAFLQSHLPPLFPSPGGSPEHSTNHMVILTPTTAEWKELKKEMGSDLERVDSSGSSDGRTSSVLSSASSEDVKQEGLMLGGVPQPKRPSLHSSMSADYLQREQTHTPDPGSSPPHQYLTPSKPVFQQNVIAPSPTFPTDTQISEPEPEIDPDQPILFDTPRKRDPTDGDSPQRFASIGRRESLRAVPKVNEPKQKTKRELERERLFRSLDEELEADKGTGTAPFEAVQQIGSGLRLSESGRIIPLDGKATDNLSLTNGEKGGTQVDFKGVGSIGSLSLNGSPTRSNSGISAGTSGTSGSSASISPTMPFKPSPLNASPLLGHVDLGSPEPDESPELDSSPNKDLQHPPVHTANLETIRDYARSLADPPAPTQEVSNPLSPVIEAKTRRLTHRRDTKRVSLVAGRVVQPFTVPPDTALPPPLAGSDRSISPLAKKASLNSFSPFHTPSITPSNSTSLSPLPTRPGFPAFDRMDSTVSIAPSIGPPSEPGTPSSETAGGGGGRGIDDYVIVSEAGKGAYGLVMRARVKGPGGEPEGEEVIIKYIVKVRILADCWKKHKVLGPIPVEIHVMDQLRHLLYHAPAKPHPWDPSRHRPGTEIGANGNSDATDTGEANDTAIKRPELAAIQAALPSPSPSPATPDWTKAAVRSYSSLFSSAQRYIASELRVSPDRGHPNICKLLDFFEDKEFYYMVMPRFGSGVDLFDRVEASPTGLAAFDVRSLVGQLADAVRFLHSNGIVHRDIKDENVILDGQGRCQLIDFGSSAHWRPGKRWDTFSGTLHYASPEILRGDLYGGKEQDVYALGTVMYVLLVGETPFAELPDEVLAGLHEGSRALEALKERCEAKEEDTETEEDGGGKLSDAQDLVMRCLELEVNDRPTAEWVCEHRFIVGKEGWVGRRGWIKPKV